MTHQDDGQIRPDTQFARDLHKLAAQSKVIVEIGTWRGFGSTLALYLGMHEQDQLLVTIDADYNNVSRAKEWYLDPRVEPVWGTLVEPFEFPEFDYPDPNARAYYDAEKLLNASCPYVLDRMPEKIDLLLIDGGLMTASIEMRKLIDRCSVIALDDTGPESNLKTGKCRLSLLEKHWRVYSDNPHERNGYFIACRPQ